MTNQTRFRAALCISLFLHFMLLHAHWMHIPARAGKGERLARELHSSAPVFSETVAVMIESASESALPADGADRLRQERNAYIEAVSAAVHARRFIAAEADRRLIGLAWFSFVSMPDSGFHDIALETSSGNPLLDRAAEAALRSASGVVKRPPGLGDEKIRLVMAVKYQYAL